MRGFTAGGWALVFLSVQLTLCVFGSSSVPTAHKPPRRVLSPFLPAHSPSRPFIPRPSLASRVSHKAAAPFPLSGPTFTSPLTLFILLKLHFDHRASLLKAVNPLNWPCFPTFLQWEWKCLESLRILYIGSYPPLLIMPQWVPIWGSTHIKYAPLFMFVSNSAVFFNLSVL